jgi:hypothetical protein
MRRLRDDGLSDMVAVPDPMTDEIERVAEDERIHSFKATDEIEGELDVYREEV